MKTVVLFAKLLIDTYLGCIESRKGKKKKKISKSETPLNSETH